MEHNHPAVVAVAGELGLDANLVRTQLEAAAEQGMTPADYIALAALSLDRSGA